MLRYRLYATSMKDADAPEARVRGVRGIQAAWAKLGMGESVGVSTALDRLDRIRAGEETLIGEHAERDRIEDAVQALQAVGINGEVREAEADDEELQRPEQAEPSPEPDDEEVEPPSIEAFQTAMILLVTTGGPGPAMQTAASLARVIEHTPADAAMDYPDSFYVEVMRAILMTFPARQDPADPLVALLRGAR